MKKISAVFVVLIVACDAMQPGVHARTKSMPVGRSLRDGSELRDVGELSDLEGAEAVAVHQTLLADGYEREVHEEVMHKPGFARKGVAWVGRHKGGLVIVLTSGLVCFYIGNRLARVSTMCGDAEDMCSDAIDHCGGAVQLLKSCMGQTAILTGFIQTLVRNGTDACVSAAHECVNAAQVAYEICKLCKEGFPPVPF